MSYGAAGSGGISPWMEGANGRGVDDKMEGVKKDKITSKLSVERVYQKKTQLEHILLRPDTYIGSVEPLTQVSQIKIVQWCINEISSHIPSDEERKYLFIVDLCLSEHTLIAIQLNSIPFEILPSTVNAADNKQRDKNMSAIKINIDPESNTISIWNNGKGIPVVEHKDEKMYVPALIFGHLLTSSNYDDDEKKVTGE
ncbi:DNA topoisomerase 2-beta-like [Hippocampus comes]|uniref:DNA topoisomerase 2-beta-like n=1 Tax=Hippocampus comes TaxID=109280 RepID=UPI00094F360D|nr:PREDICTED: DNA topoisomerase 2-beta-like [Hippocampus comes]